VSVILCIDQEYVFNRSTIGQYVQAYEQLASIIQPTKNLEEGCNSHFDCLGKGQCVFGRLNKICQCYSNYAGISCELRKDEYALLQKNIDRLFKLYVKPILN
jgi:hypothetical protein